MNFLKLVEWIDDHLNPIVVKELRQAVKSRMVVGILGLFLMFQLLLLGFALLTRQESYNSASMEEWTIGLRIFSIQQGILLFTIMIAVPAYACVRFANERTEQNVDLMFISTLRPASIIWGKFFAATILGLLVFSTCAPFMTFAYLLRGIDIPSMLIILGIDLLAMFFGIMVAIFVAAIPGGRGVKVFFSLAGFILLFSFVFPLMAMTIEFLERGVLEELTDYWYMILIALVGVFSVIGLLFFYSVALISPLSANRILPLRIFLLFAWLVFGLAMFFVSFYVPSISGGASPFPIIGFVLLSTPILCIQLWISFSERTHLGPRVARTIPLSRLLRPLAFLFYTGSAGGVIFSGSLILATLVGAALWAEAQSLRTPDWEVLYQAIRLMSALTAYCYCFGLTAVLFRKYFLSEQVNTSVTWLIAALFVGLGSSVPTVFAYIVFSEQLRYHYGPGWWSLTNPIYVLMWLGEGRFNSQSPGFELMLVIFLLCWGLLVTVLWVPSFLHQVRNFKPLTRTLDLPLPSLPLERVSISQPSPPSESLQTSSIQIEGQS